ncbi:YsnF/AvaK domain-containing protein [Micromonospora yasonensis]|uniref:YsnF/AvaK domain-containing protein n=1 Tax=Micromonospora yasonensis TaxID=1128667 RepID=UPI00222E8EB0|nr:YsnF/AvaK domain-containing protein [Micromonospora yasonensis]MCW3839998.1 YsnF/AvaK domain-containing protein [Micromonospora yasonensis]
MRLTEQQIRSLYGQDVQDRSGATIGNVGQVWADAAGEPTWVSVRTGAGTQAESMAPLHAARLQEGRVRLPYDRATVRGAPAVESGSDQPLGVDQLTQLYRHYQLPGQGAVRQPEPPGRATGPPEVVRSAERARFDTVREPVGTARLRKRVVTENVQTTVPVAHDEVTVVHEPITDPADVRAELGEEQHEMLLYAERPVAVKERVPVERVRLARDEVVEEQPAHAQVRREVVDADVPERARRDR